MICSRVVVSCVLVSLVATATEYETFSAVVVPAGYRAEPQRGPDFIVTSYYAPAAKAPVLSVYEGTAPSFPSFCKTEAKPKQEKHDGIMESTVRTSGVAGLCRESLLQIRGRGEVRHVWYRGLSRQDAKLADSIISRIRMVTVKE